MPVWHLLLLVVAVVCFGLSATGIGAPFWNRLISVGLTALGLSLIQW